MKITIYQKDQGAHKTSWKEYGIYDEDNHYHVNFEGGLIWVRRTTFVKHENQDYPETQTIFCGGSENFYFTRE